MSIGYGLHPLLPPVLLPYAQPPPLPSPSTHPGPLLAHCGAWWPIVPGQVVCGACGRVYREEA